MIDINKEIEYERKFYIKLFKAIIYPVIIVGVIILIIQLLN